MSHPVGSTRMFYGNYEFMPVPVFSWSTEMIRDNKQEELSLRNTLDFTGVLLEVLPTESGIFPNMYLQRELLKRALTESGVQQWRITYEGNTVQSGIFPRVQDVNFEEGVWVDRINYTFSFVFDQALSGKTPVDSFNETWTFEENDDRRSVTVNHDLSAVGVNTSASGISNALVNARIFVLARTGYSNVPAGHPAFVEGSGTLQAYEERRTESVDVQQGSFSVTESFTLSSGNFTHLQTGQLNTDAEGITTVSLDGAVRGLGRGDHAYTRALAAWIDRIRGNLPGQASGVYNELGGIATLFTSNPESLSVTRNPFAGTIDYSISFTDDPTQDLPSGVQDFTITVQDDKPVRLFASFAIMERTLGNVVQDIATSTEGRITIAGSAIGKQGFPFNDLLDFVEGRINLLRPISASYITLRLDQKSVTKDEAQNTVNFTLVWLYTKELSAAAIDGPVSLD